jgi:hypothetical protein
MDDEFETLEGNYSKLICFQNTFAENLPASTD